MIDGGPGIELGGAAWAAWVLAPALFVAALSATGLPAQSDAEAALGTDTATVGDVVPVVVRVRVGAGERVLWPDTLPLAGSSLENAARVRERADTMEDGRTARTGVYAVTPWRTGELALPGVPVRVVGSGTSVRDVQVPLPTLMVASVLPADTVGVEPRPARGVIGPSWAWGRIIALLLLVALAAAVLVSWWWRRHRSGPETTVLEPAVPPRARALAALQAARESGLLEQGELKEFYSRLTDAVRGYAAALDPAWGVDLTTTELLGRLRQRVGVAEAAGLRAVLAPADRVKFARREPDRETALAEWEAARTWVTEFDGPPPAPVTREAA